MSDKKTMVDIRDAEKDFGVVMALKGVDLKVAEGEVVLVIGPRDRGKVPF